MEVSKVQLANGEVLVDLTNDSVTEETLAEGATAHDASGKMITGTMKSGGGVSVQSDWNQTDETAADFIKNKPFGDVPTVILEEQELVYTPELEGWATPVTDTIQAGDTLIVVVDGVSYDAEVSDFNGFAIWGNLSLPGIGVDTGEPFFGMYSEGIAIMMFVDEQSHTVEISKYDVTKLPDKYYDNYCLMYASGQYLYLDAGLTTKATKNDVIKVIKLRPIIVTMEDATEGIFVLNQSCSAQSTNTLGLGNEQGLVVYFLVGNTIMPLFTAEYQPTT